MMSGELLFEDLPTEDAVVPSINWPAYSGSLQTAFYQLMSTPSHVRALSVVGALSSFRFVLFCFCSVCGFLSSEILIIHAGLVMDLICSLMIYFLMGVPYFVFWSS